MTNEIKEKVLKGLKVPKFQKLMGSSLLDELCVQAIDLTLAEVGKVIDDILIESEQDFFSFEERFDGIKSRLKKLKEALGIK